MSDFLNAPLAGGLDVVSGSQSVPFTQYVRHILPLDGYVFWLRTKQTMITGSLHIGIDERQNEDENIAVNSVRFTTAKKVECFNDISPSTIWVGETAGIRFAFSRRGFFYDNAGLYHYSGEAVYPVMESQLVDVGSELPLDTLIVSNSLPAWLALKSYAPFWLVPKNPDITLYPSFAVPANLRPPYGVVHLDPARTDSLQSAPLIGPTGSHTQLATDHFRLTFYGLTNQVAQDWVDTFNRYSVDTGVLGLMSSPIMRDEKRGQVGLDILAMKKTFEGDVAYNQSAMRDVARQLITSVAVTVIPN